MLSSSASQPPATRQSSRSLVVTVASCFVIVYIVFNLEAIRSERCRQPSHLANSSVVSAPASAQGPSQKAIPLSAGGGSLAAPDPRSPPRVTAAQGRRMRPMPSCVDGTPAGGFLIVFMGHSGSTALLTELRAHSRTQVRNLELVDHQPTFNTTEALQMARAFFSRGIANGLMPGFKIRPAHILNQPEKWRDLVDEFNLRIIWQYRKNLIKGSVGEYKKRFLKDLNVVEGLKENLTEAERCALGAGCSFKIEDFDFFHGVLRGMLRSNRMIVRAVKEIAQRTGCVREIPYEDYLYDRQAVMDDIFRFLGVESEETSPDRFKATGDNMCEVVKNWDEMCNHFYGCVLWQHMFDDEENGCFCKMTSGFPKYDPCEAYTSNRMN